MRRTLKHGLSIAMLLLYCLVAVHGAEAQNVAQWVVMSSNKLGLTLDQKTKIETVQKDIENQRQAVLDNAKLNRNERVAKLREIKDGERTRVNEVLTFAQQRKLKNLMYPKREWAVSVYITAGSNLAHCTARLDGYPSKYLSYTIHKQDIRLNVLDADEKLVPNGPRLMLAPNVPDVIRPVLDEMGSRVCQVEFILDRKTAKPGLYTLRFRTSVDATDVETHERVKLDDAVTSQRVYVTPQPDHDPALQPGQRFIGTPWTEASASLVTPYQDIKSGKPITWREIAARIATLQRIEPCQDGNRLTFVLEGHTGQLFIETKCLATDLPYLTPLLTDHDLRSLKAQYEEKHVWCYGGPGVQCVSTEPGMSISMSGRIDVPLRIRHVERVYMPHAELAIGTATFIGGERESAFVTDNPLVVILDAPTNGLEFSAFSYVGDKDTEAISLSAVSNPRANCLGLWNELCDRWDFEREYSLSSPFKTHPKWPARIRKAVLKGELVKGMTRELVAWAIGWPSIYGTKSEMLSIDDWAYDNIPSQGHVYFKSNRMSKEEWPRFP